MMSGNQIPTWWEMLLFLLWGVVSDLKKKIVGWFG